MPSTCVIAIRPTEVLPDASRTPTAASAASDLRARIDAHQALSDAAEILRRGGLVAFPTETVYGLGADALDAEAVERIYTAKGRPPTNPVIVHVPDTSMARTLTASWPANAEALAQTFWPGPLTLVLPKADAVPDIVTAGRATVALRVPAHPIALALLRVAALPVAAPSANISTNLSPTTAEHVMRGLDGRIDLVIDGGPTTGGIESTVVDLTGTQPTVLRPGLIGADALSRALGAPVAQPSVTTAVNKAASAPGQHQRHYSPRTPLTLAEDDGSSTVQAFAQEGMRVAWIRFADAADRNKQATDPISSTDNASLATVETHNSIQPNGNVLIRWLPLDPTACAAALYALLHDLDDLGLGRIVMAQPPIGDDWRAISDRLQRAAAT